MLKRITIALLLMATLAAGQGLDDLLQAARQSLPKGAATYWTDTNSYVYLVEFETTNTTAFLGTEGSNRHFSWEGTPTLAKTICGTNSLGRVENCTSFTGANDLYRLQGDSFSIFSNGTNDRPFSIGFWLNITSFPAAGTYDIVFSRFFSTAADWAYDCALYNFNSGTNYLEFRIHNVTGASVAKWFVLTGIATNTWNQYVVTYSGVGGSTAYTGMTGYSNGAVFVSALNLTNGVYTCMDTKDRYILLKGDSAGTFYNGKIDHFFVTSNQLSAGAVSELYNYTNPQNNLRAR